MTLLEIRTKFVQVTGRFDLVASPSMDDYDDAGADFFIRAGQDYLDRKVNFSKENVAYAVAVVAGTYRVNVGRFRALQKVEVVKADGQRYFLDRLSWRELLVEYGSGPPFQAEGDVPAHYVLEVLRGAAAATTASESHTGILFAPTPVQDVTLILHGLRYSNELLIDADISYWSLAHPFLLVQAAAMKAEEAYRNRQGVQDHKVPLDESLLQLYHDTIEQDVMEMVQMQSAW